MTGFSISLARDLRITRLNKPLFSEHYLPGVLFKVAPSFENRTISCFWSSCLNLFLRIQLQVEWIQIKHLCMKNGLLIKKNRFFCGKLYILR